MKEISLHSTQELFSFKWQEFKNDYPEHSLAKLVFQHLHEGKVEAPYLGIKDLMNSGVIIWPVVPRDIVNAIHRGQAEVIRLLVLLGWRVHLLIADCGSLNNYEKSDSIRFSEKLKKYMANRGIEQIKISYLSDFFAPTNQDYDRIQEIFRDIISDLTLQDFLNIVNKGYTDRVKDDILRRATLDCLRPVLSLAVVLYLAQEARQKSIIVAGADERRQWERAYDIPKTRDRIGVLMIPVLTEDGDKHQMLLSKAGPIWSSQPALRRAMDSSNTAWWTFHLLAFIPAFPAPFVTISGKKITPRDWSNESEVPERIRKEDLTQQVWEILNPAS
jgi:hypothetical protein